MKEKGWSTSIMSVEWTDPSLMVGIPGMLGVSSGDFSNDSTNSHQAALQRSKRQAAVATPGKSNKQYALLENYQALLW